MAIQSGIRYMMPTREDLIIRQILNRYFACSTLLQSMILNKVKSKNFPEKETIEFISHVGALWMSTAPLTRLDFKRAERLLEMGTVSLQAKESFKMFKRLGSELNRKGILNVKMSGVKLTARQKAEGDTLGF